MQASNLSARRAAASIAPLALGLFLLVGSGCRRDMQDQPKYLPLQASHFFNDGRSSRHLVPGTVARGHLDANVAFYTGRTAAGTYAEQLPFPLTKRVLERGEERFNIYCSPCHDRVGRGSGMIVRRGFRRPPSFHIERLRQARLGHFFDVMTNGFGAMPSYAAQVTARDRWNIAAYIRALQLSQRASIADVPQTERQKLQSAHD